MSDIKTKETHRDIKVLDKDGEEIDLRTSFDNETGYVSDENKEAFSNVNDAETGEGFGIDEDSLENDIYQGEESVDEDDDFSYSAVEDIFFDEEGSSEGLDTMDFGATSEDDYN